MNNQSFSAPKPLSDREFEDMLLSKQREVRERRKRIVEAGDPDAGEDLWEDWLDEKRKLKDERREEVDHWRLTR
jgi:predicted metal-dependent hydrolase